MQNLLFFLLMTTLSVVSGQCGCSFQRMLRRRHQYNWKMGDMILDKRSLIELRGYKGNETKIKRWPKGEVLYAFGETFPENRKPVVLEALYELERDLGGCIKFKQSISSHYVEINSIGNDCYSQIGYLGGPKQEVNFGKSSCLAIMGKIKHEFMHVLGFIHTHMRSDRDRYVTINWQNIQKDECYNFEICEGCSLDIPYETTSIMHYSSSAFSCQEELKTILKIDGEIIPPNFFMTANDLQMIKIAYKC